MARRFLIAPDKFKGSLSAFAAAKAIAEGVRRAEPDAVIDLCPIADGGEGFMATLATVLDGRWVSCPAVDALGRSIESRYLLAQTPEGLTAIMEMAETAGLWRLSDKERDPIHATTRGVGMQMAHATGENSVSRIILGIGGSATNDGGCGMAAALGIAFFDENDTLFDPNPSNLLQLHRIARNSRIVLPEILAACDVDNPLLGLRGATAVFSSQKGASEEDRLTLEKALSQLVRVSESQEAANVPGAGAAGGLGFGLLAFASAKLIPGLEMLESLLHLETRIKLADFIITGEGSMDHQSLGGKGPVALAKMAKIHATPVACFCGRADEAARTSGLFHSLYALADTEIPIQTLMSQAAPLLSDLVAGNLPMKAE